VDNIRFSATRRVAVARHALAFLDRRSGWFLPVWGLCYFVAAVPDARRPLWYDELLTYYTATASDLHQFIGRVLNADLNPPLAAVLARASVMALGDCPFAVRLPSLLAFFGAGLLVYAMARRRYGGAYGLAAMALLWSCGFFRYAVEARPYALVLFFFTFSVFCWVRATEQFGSRWAHWGLMGGIAGMFMAHCFAPLFAASIGIGELVRTVCNKRIDRKIWLALLLPLPLALTYIPFVRGAHEILYPPEFQPTFLTPILFYCLMVARPGILLLVPFVFLSAQPNRMHSPDIAGRHEMIVAITGLLTPVAIIAYSMCTQIAFWQRYGIGAAASLSLILIAAVAYRAKCDPAVGGAVALMMIAQFIVTSGLLDQRHFERSMAPGVHRNIRTDLPFVAASGLTFLEMDHRETPEFVRRLYYLTGREAAVQYAHATIFEALPRMKRWLPVRANVQPYRAFVAVNRAFLVLATPGYPEDWLLPKLQADGARIEPLGRIETGYRNRHLFLVSLPQPAPNH
jgi:hypothetical protein